MDEANYDNQEDYRNSSNEYKNYIFANALIMLIRISVLGIIAIGVSFVAPQIPWYWIVTPIVFYVYLEGFIYQLKRYSFIGSYTKPTISSSQHKHFDRILAKMTKDE